MTERRMDGNFTFEQVSCRYVALKPPSKFKTVLFAYALLARKTAASATSLVVPKRPRGMEAERLPFWSNAAQWVVYQ